MSGRIPLSAPDLTAAEERAVVEVLRSGRLALGPRTTEFERRIAEYVGVGHAVAVSSGTAALHVILAALEIGPGDEVLVPSFTFPSPVNVILYVGADPVFVDIEPDTFNLCPQDLERKITPKSRAIMAVDMFGHPVDQDAIEALAARHDLRLVDDACEALGADYGGRRVGRFGRAATFAFYPNKQVTTGEGGIVVTDDAALAETVRCLRNQGRARMDAEMRYERLGYSYRLNELSAALGCAQMQRIDELLARRDRVFRAYGDRLKDRSWARAPVVRDGVRLSPFVYVVLLAEGLDRSRVIEGMEALGIETRAYFPPMHLEPYIRNRPGHRDTELPRTAAIAPRTLALPFHGNMDVATVERVLDSLERVIQALGIGGIA